MTASTCSGDMSSTGKMLQALRAAARGRRLRRLQGAGRHPGRGRGGRAHRRDHVRPARSRLCAVRAAREACDLPVIASIAFNTAGNEGRTVMGNTARQCAEALTEAGAVAVGANCGSVDPLEMAQIVAMMREATSLPIIAQPNAGKGRMVDKRAGVRHVARRLRRRGAGVRAGRSPARRRLLRHVACPHPGDGGADRPGVAPPRATPGAEPGYHRCPCPECIGRTTIGAPERPPRARGTRHEEDPGLPSR